MPELRPARGVEDLLNLPGREGPIEGGTIIDAELFNFPASAGAVVEADTRRARFHVVRLDSHKSDALPPGTGFN